MDLAKSLFENRNHEGYVGKDAHTKRELQLAIEPDDMEDNFVENFTEGLNMNDPLTPTPGGPFSALTPSMWPQDIMAKQSVIPDDPNSQPEYRFDEFGFRVDEEDGPEQNSNKLLGIPFVEDPQHRLQWVAHLEFSHNKEVSDLTWDKVEVRLPRTDKLLTMVKSGIPHSLRPQMWMRMSGALEKKQQSELCYKEIIKMSSNDSLMTSKQIEKDLLHTMPTNACYSHANSTGIPRLRRILRGVAWLYPDIGYCQGMGMIAASLLLFMEEENAFWIMVTIVEDLLPASYYSSTLLGIQADQRVLRTLIVNYLPDIDETLKNHDIELSLITLHWFLTLFASVVHMKILLRIWDLFFFEGSIVLFQITLSMLKMKEPHLRELENSAQIFNALSDIPGDIDDVDKLLEISTELTGSLNEVMIETYRRRHLAYLMADQGALVGNPEAAPNLPKQHLARKKDVNFKNPRDHLKLVCFNNIMDDAKRENNRIKRSKSDVKNVLSGYLQKRNYSALQTFESSNNQHIIYSSLENGVGRSNSILYSCYNSDPIVIDQNFTRFLTWLKEQTTENSHFHDIEVIVGPLFCHLYMDILHGGHSEGATSFFTSHFPAIDKSKCDDTVNELIKQFASESDSTKVKEKFRSKKVTTELSQESLAILKKFVLENCHVVFLQVLQTWFDFREGIDIGCATKKDKDMISVDYSREHKYHELLSAIRNLKRKPVPTYNIKISNNKQSISCGLLKRQCGLVAFAEHNILRLMPIHCLDSLFNLNKNLEQIKFTCHSDQIYSIAISPNNNTLVTASADHSICIYTLVEVRLLKRCTGHLGPVYCVKISSNGEYIASGSMDATARLWDIRTGKILRVFAGHTQPVTCLDFHPNCLYIVTGSADKNIRLWGLGKAAPLRLFHAAKSTVYAIAFNPSGKLLASASEDKKIRIWDLLTSKIVAELRCKDSPIVRLVWNKDGRELCAGTLDGILRIWDFPSTQNHWENSKNHEPAVTQVLNSKLLSLEYTLGSYGTLTV